MRSAFYENGELIFEAGISKREIAQEMLLLLEEGHLSNAFSITMSDFDYNFESETISNAEIIEVSLVFRGANREARLLAVKSLKGEEMNQEKETPEVLTTAYPEVVADNEPEVEQAENSTENNNYNEEKEEEMDKELAKDAISKAAPSQTMKSSSNYLETREAMNDYAKILEKSKRIRLEVMADINELGGRMASADREQYISLTQERESLQETLETIEASIRAMESILQWRVDSSGGRLEIDKELLNLQRYSGLTLEELAQDCGIVL